MIQGPPSIQGPPPIQRPPPGGASAAPGGPVPAGGLAAALRRALRGPPGRVVLRVEEAAPHRRRVARALLQEGALAAGGQVLDGPGGDLLLVGAEPGRAERLRGLLERLVGPAAMLLWSLDRDGAALVAYAEGAAAPPRPVAEGPGLAGLDPFLDAMPLAQVVRRVPGVALAAGAAPRPAFLRLEPAREAIAGALGALGADADLLDHAARRVAGRLLAALADAAEARALLGPALPARLHLPLPVGFAPTAQAAPGRLVATLPLAEAATGAALAARIGRLAEAGIAAELDGLDAAALALLDPGALPPALLRLHWSPELAAPTPLAALRRLDPARLVLAGATGEPARAFAAALGITLVEAPA